MPNVLILELHGDNYNLAATLLDIAREVRFHQRHGILTLTEEGELARLARSPHENTDGTLIARVKLAQDFYKLPTATIFKALVEDWNQCDIVKAVY